MPRAECTILEFALDDCFMHILVKKEGETPYLFSFRFNKIKCNLIKIVRCSNFPQIFIFLNIPALNYQIQSTHLIGILLHFKLSSCPALASEGCHFMWTMCTQN